VAAQQAWQLLHAFQRAVIFSSLAATETATLVHSFSILDGGRMAGREDDYDEGVVDIEPIELEEVDNGLPSGGEMPEHDEEILEDAEGG